MSILLRMKLDHYEHKGKALFFDTFDLGGNVLYGAEKDSLIYPEGLDIIGRFPVTLTDVKNAFRLGLKAGREEKT